MSRKRSFDYGAAKKLADEGVLHAEIARRLGVSVHSVRRALNNSYREMEIERAKARSRRNWASHLSSARRYAAVRAHLRIAYWGA